MFEKFEKYIVENANTIQGGTATDDLFVSIGKLFPITIYR